MCTRIFQIYSAIFIETGDFHAVFVDFEDTGAEGGTGFAGTYIAHITRIHVGKVKGRLCKVTDSTTHIGNQHGIAGCIVNAGAADVAVVTTGVVMAEQEDDVQALASRLVQYIYNVTCAVVVIAAIVMQRQMGHDKDRLGIACFCLGIQPGF